MRRADRLFQIVQTLRRRRVTTARQLAERLEVSERTVYRDIRDLTLSGVPIEGEAGVGYLLRGYDLPPLMFTHEEIEALVLGARIVESWTDQGLARAARQALDKVEAVLPTGTDDILRETPLFAPDDHARVPVQVDLAEIRRAIRERRKIRFRYVDANGSGSRRTVRPVGMAFYGHIWILGAWCELRDAFRAFRPDRMRDAEFLGEIFEPEAGKGLADFVSTMERQARNE